MLDINQRLNAIEDRLFAIEQKLGLHQAPPPTRVAPVAAPVVESIKKSPAVAPLTPSVALGAERPSQPKPAAPRAYKAATPEPVEASRWMAWCAGITFVLATLYFLKLVYDSGWLTPMRQVSLAYLSAAALVTCGFLFAKEDRQYAAYLPAVGLVVLYLTTFIAHLYYQLMPSGMALVVVGVITLFGIWLGRHFGQSVYVIFSALGVYAAPLLVKTRGGDLLDLVIYYSAWSLLFSFCAVQEKRRLTYLLPMYMAILGFDMVFRLAASDEWQLAAVYQLVQFLIFGMTTVIYSVLNRSVLEGSDALPHGVALFLFYGIEYALLLQHVPELVNYLAIISAIVVFLFYAVANRWYAGGESLRAGSVLVSYYCSWVAVHAVFFGLLNHDWWPWAALCTPLVFRIMASLLEENPDALTPITLACIGLFVLGYAMSLIAPLRGAQLGTSLPTLALFVYALLLFGMYYQQSRDREASSAGLMLYAGHLAVLMCLVKWVKSDIYLSALWAVYGVSLLLIALAIKDKVLGKSALLIFAAAAFKVLLFDLSGSNSVTRVVVLLVMSASLYAGGWLYQSLVRVADEEPTTRIG